MKIGLFCFTSKGANLGQRIRNWVLASNYDFEGYSKYSKESLLPLEDNLSVLIEASFTKGQAIIFIGAMGIAVRLIAPYIKTKAKDPAVIVIDENGENVIPILSGHLGGANELAKKLADFLQGRAIITTATDINKLFAVDVWAKEQKLYIEDIGKIKYISSAILKKEKIGLYSDYPVDGNLPEFLARKNEKVESGILISNGEAKKPFLNTLHLVPKSFVIGLGCRKNTSEKALEEFILETLDSFKIPIYLINCLATIDIKKNEKAIVDFSEKYSIPLITYTNEQLSRAEGKFTASKFVKSIVGVDNVCERAAFLASDKGSFKLGKLAKEGITIAIAKKEWRCSF